MFRLGPTLAAAVFWPALVGVAIAQDTIPPSETAPPSRAPAITWGAEVDVVSRYLWRGFPFSDGTVLWPSASVSARGLTASLWTNIEPGFDPAFNEYDLAVAYQRSIGRLTLTATYTRYAYFEGDVSLSTTELIGRAAYAIGNGEIFTNHAFDVDQYRGSYYLEAGYAVRRELGSKSTLTADASIAFWSKFIEKYAGVSNSPVGPVTINVAWTRQLAPHVFVRPHVTVSRIADAEARKLLNPPPAAFGVAAVFAY